MYLFLSLIFHIIRKKNALETTKKVSCSIIYFLMFAKSKFYCNFSRCFCISLLGSERLAGEDGCNSGYCFGASESFVSKKISFFEYDVLLVYVLKRFRPGIQQVYKGFLRIFVPSFSSWKPTKWKSYLSSLIIFVFVPLQKNLLLSIIPLSEVHWLFGQA